MVCLSHLVHERSQDMEACLDTPVQNEDLELVRGCH